MSSIYNLEPQPTGSAIIHTNQGELSVELFAKQTPLTCRNFLQLALDGYYDDTVFHRLIPGFVLQGGDPSGTGNGGESIYDAGALSGDLDPWPMDQRKGRNAGPMGMNFKDEFHSRLKFNRRGLLGMANEGVPDTNGSQFFFTLGKTEELASKNTVFGRVAGDTIYNLAKIGEVEVEEGTERPLYPIKIVRVEILVNPFSDVRRTERKVRPELPKAAAASKKQQKRKGGKQLLSFGDEEGNAEDVPALKKAKFDTRIVMDDSHEQAPNPKVKGIARKEEKPAIKTIPVRESRETEPVQKQTAKPAPLPEKETAKAKAPIINYEIESDMEPDEPAPKKKTLLEQTNDEIAALKASMRRTIHSEPVKEKKITALEQLIPETSTRGRRRRADGTVPSKETLQSLKVIQSFQSKLKQAPEGSRNEADLRPVPRDGDTAEQADKDDEEAEVCDLHFIANCKSCQSWDKLEAEKEGSDDEGWMSHQLSFAADKLGKDLSYRKKAEEELVVIDPLAKARTLKEEKQAARDARSGGSGRAWDQARNAQMSKASTLAGRGAR